MFRNMPCRAVPFRGIMITIHIALRVRVKLEVGPADDLDNLDRSIVSRFNPGAAGQCMPGFL